MSHRHRHKTTQIADCLACGYAIFHGCDETDSGSVIWRHVGSNTARCNTTATPPKTHENPWQKPWPRSKVKR